MPPEGGGCIESVTSGNGGRFARGLTQLHTRVRHGACVVRYTKPEAVKRPACSFTIPPEEPPGLPLRPLHVTIKML